MNYRNIFITLAALSGTVTASAWSAESATVAFLMPDQASTRYEQHDFPGFKAEMSKLCADCKVIYQNANANASLQQQQFNSVIAQGAKVIVLDPVDSSAAAALVENAQAQGVKVIAYDRPVPDKPADFYVSFDNEGIGYAIAKSLTDHLKASGVPQDAGVQPLPPVTGNDATIAALQLIIAGDQYNTISKPSEIVAAAAAKVAVDFIQGKKPQASTTLYNTPSQLFTPEVVTAKNIKAEIFDKKIQTWDQVCSGEYAAACQKLGISK
ncbi:TPA: substrate-binding domain-containing protein [Klebsiella pneumoniae]|nr:substrate-binding domain-containing protein [Klebsiella pneumoniae]HEL6388452.1 substrate-binding domain-containing protein [Klebsiella pneumoniae]